MKKILFKNPIIATDTQLIEGDLLVEGEKIAGFGGNFFATDATVIDASGKYLLPGGVDPHTHFDLDVGFDRSSDDFYTGGIAAACGGTTTVIDHMAFGPDRCRLTHQIDVYRKLAKRCVIDYGFHGTLQHVDDAVLADMEKLPGEGITSLKFYTTYSHLLLDEDILLVMSRAKELGLTLCVHCENDAIVRMLTDQYLRQGHTQARYHPLARPPQAEAEAVFRCLSLAQAAAEPKLYIVHLSSAKGLCAARAAGSAKKDTVFLETCPQYLFLHEELYDKDEEGLKYIAAPPLRSKEDSRLLWQALANKDIDTIGTDHCPFAFSTQKQRGKNNFSLTPNGMPGVELRLPLLFSEGFMAGRLSLPDVVRLCCTKPAQIFGLTPQKGTIRPGADADLVLFDPTIHWVVHQKDLHENVDYTPYEGMHLQGRPILTLSRGETIVSSGRFRGERGRGQYLKRH